MARVAFLGTGLLGSGMVEAMLRRGEAVTVWNRTADKARALEALGARAADTPEAAVADAERVHLALADDASVDGLLPRVVSGLRAGTAIVDHTTTAPVSTGARISRLARAGTAFVHAPVFMSPQMCRDAVGMMLVAGPGTVFDRVRPALEPMTGEVWYLGERGDLAAACKIFGNAMIFAMIAGLGDILAMARTLEVPFEQVSSLFSRFKVGGVIPARLDKMARGDYSASFELTMARKDMRLMLEAAGAARLTVLPGIAQRMDEAIARGHGQDDLGAIAAENSPARRT
jgi:3-hydroxyisobutyrate dehydrogenase